MSIACQVQISRLVTGAILALTAFGLAGCASVMPKLAMTGTTTPAAESTAKVPAAAGDAASPLAQARALKKAGKAREAFAVLEAAPETARRSQPLIVEQGLLALELGKVDQAHGLLTRAAAADTKKDWRIHSGLGIAAANLGKQAEAQSHFAKALELSPNNPTVLNNQAVSLMLDRKLNQAEGLLKKAAAADASQARAKSNLALARALRAEAAGGTGQAAALQDGGTPIEQKPDALASADTGARQTRQ